MLHQLYGLVTLLHRTGRLADWSGLRYVVILRDARANRIETKSSRIAVRFMQQVLLNLVLLRGPWPNSAIPRRFIHSQGLIRLASLQITTNLTTD